VKYALTTTAFISAVTIGHTFDNRGIDFGGYSNTSLYQFTREENVSDDQLRGVYAEKDFQDTKERAAKLGAFHVSAGAAAEVTFDDNIFATDSNEESDTILSVRPTVSATSDWSRHELSGSAYLQSDSYASNDDEDTVDFGGRVSGRLDVKRGAYITGNAFAEERHEDRGNPNSALGSTEPTEFTRTGGELRGVYAPGRVSVAASVGVENHEFENGETASGASINNGDRDRTAVTTSIRGGYEFKPGYEAFAQVSYIDTEYDEVDLAVGDERSSDGYDAIVGLSTDITSKLQGEAYVGITERSYDAASLGDIDEPTFGGNLVYRPSALTSVQVGLVRSIEETTLSNASGFVQTAISGRVEHAVRENVLLGADLLVAQNEYEGGSLDREDDIVRAGVDARYDFNDNVAASLGYEITERDSTQSGADFTRGRFMTRLLGKF